MFIGNAGGDVKGVKGRMYALDAKTGKIMWEFYLVPKTEGDRDIRARGCFAPQQLNLGQHDERRADHRRRNLDVLHPRSRQRPHLRARRQSGAGFFPGERPGENLYSGSVVVLDAKTGAYRKHFKIVPKDWHDWDVSSAPVIIKTAANKTLLSLAPKDGHLYGIDLSTGDVLYRQPMTRMENETAPFEVGKPVHFCPGSTGGAEWNGPGYDPQNNLIYVGEVDWCTTVMLQPAEKIADTAPGAPWSGEDSVNPFNTWGKGDPVFDWAGFVTAVDADTGTWKWRAKTNYPVQSGMTPTAGGVVFFGDMGGNFYALDSEDGRKLWGEKIGGAVGGGVITYEAGDKQKVAVAHGLTEILWPTEITTAKVSVLGLE